MTERDGEESDDSEVEPFEGQTIVRGFTAFRQDE